MPWLDSRAGPWPALVGEALRRAKGTQGEVCEGEIVWRWVREVHGGRQGEVGGVTRESAFIFEETVQCRCRLIAPRSHAVSTPIRTPGQTTGFPFGSHLTLAALLVSRLEQGCTSRH